MRSMQSRVTASHVISPAAILATISVAINSLSRRPTFTSIAWRSVLAGAPGRGTGDLAKHGARYESRAAGIIEIEQAADQFAGGIEAADRRSEERRVGKEGRSRWTRYHENNKQTVSRRQR